MNDLQSQFPEVAADADGWYPKKSLQAATTEYLGNVAIVDGSREQPSITGHQFIDYLIATLTALLNVNPRISSAIKLFANAVYLAVLVFILCEETLFFIKVPRDSIK